MYFHTFHIDQHDHSGPLDSFYLGSHCLSDTVKTLYFRILLP